MQEFIKYLYGLKKFGMKLGLETTEKVLEVLSNPHKKFRSIHIAGTNGKGSTAAFTASILEKAGYKVGLYTSPHLIKFNERIKVNGEDISNEELVRLTEKIKGKTEGLQPTFFEFTTALAFLHFAESKVEIAVIETGLGGSYDSTNVLTPEISVITNIALDHKEHLGDTKNKIAMDKAGIIKNNFVITAEKDENLIEIFRERASKILVLKDELNYEIIEKNLDFQKFNVSGREFKIPLQGQHQIDNACTALLIAGRLNISDEAMKDGLLDVKWPGRLQVISKEPLVIVDGAHNPEGMEKLAKFIGKGKKLIIGISKDKEISKMISCIAPLFEEVIVTQSNFKPEETTIIAEEAKKYCGKVKEIPDSREALKEALSSVKKDEMVLVTGSLYLVGNILKQLPQQGIE